VSLSLRRSHLGIMRETSRVVVGVAVAALITFGVSGCGAAQTLATSTCPPPGRPQCSEAWPIPAPTPPDTPTPAPATTGYTGPPNNPEMLYMGVTDINEIRDYNPECVSSFCDLTVGTKMPDRCCVKESWKNAAGNLPPSFYGGGDPDILYRPDDPTQQPVTCYARVAPGPFNGGVTGGEVQWIRNYIGCEDGKLQAHENCVPGGVQYVTPEQYAEGNCNAESCPWSYPMSSTKGPTTFENGTGASCHCSTLSHFKRGPGCYIAFATLAQYPGFYPAVFVKVSGTCEGPGASMSSAGQSSDS